MRISQNAGNYNCFLLVIEVGADEKVIIVGPRATVSTSENRLEFFIDLAAQQYQKLAQNGAPNGLTTVNNR